MRYHAASACGRQVQFQVQFGACGGSYVQHGNTVHEDFAMLMRIQLRKEGGSFAAVSVARE
ncbi:MAG: hypothetical protein WAO08_14770 [Hyphomicrobiaceae bacterium]